MTDTITASLADVLSDALAGARDDGSARRASRALSEPGPHFEHRMQGEPGQRLHYVIGGQGEPLLLVPGWPQTWYAWRKTMRALARHYTVVAIDPPGLGDSDRPPGGYDTDAVAERLHAFTRSLGWDRFHYVGHDVGVWIGYAYASRYGRYLDKLALIDATIPGIAPKEAYAFEPQRISKNWHFYFFAMPDLAEALLTGREREFLGWLFQSKSAGVQWIEPHALDEYARCYGGLGGWRAGASYYRALFQDMEQNQAHARERLTMPVLAMGGEAALGGMMETMLRRVADNVTGVIAPCGHYVPEEAPEFLVAQLRAFLG
ncbi:alpha/beta fold hydrolase [Pseudomonadota bacterium AL_CKDN230030165-1A_HGKHYDSX7]